MLRPGPQVLLRAAGAVAVLGVLTTPLASYTIRTVMALAAATLLMLAAARHRDDLRTSRRFFAAALMAGTVAGVIAVVYRLATGDVSSPGGFHDWLFLAYVPLGVGGILVLPRADVGRSGTFRALADGAVAAGALWYLATVLVIDPQGERMRDGIGAITLAYLLLPAFGIAVLLSALPQVALAAREFALRAGIGIVVIGLSDMAFSVAAWNGTYQPTSWIAALYAIGILLVLDAAVGTLEMFVDRSTQPQPVDQSVASKTGQLLHLMPYLPMVIALAVGTREMFRGEGMSQNALPPVLVIGLAVVARHLASSAESTRLIRDLAERERAARALARTDSLTGLLNQGAFLDELRGVLRDPAQHPVAVAMLDLDDFKDINDTHGHDTGDEVLRSIAARLRRSVPGGIVARLGGDEFAAFVGGTADGGRRLSEQLADAFSERVALGSRTFSVRPSIGIVLDEHTSGGDDDAATLLLAHADIAMYKIKDAKGARSTPVVVLSGHARAKASATIRIREEISKPDLGQFHLVYQPLVDLSTGRLRGVEALMRWEHPEFGVVAPSVFVPMAERVGSISALGNCALQRALDDLARWVAVSGTVIGVGVNVSPTQLTDPGVAKVLTLAMQARRLPASQLTLEVTEQALVDDMDAMAETVAALRAAGMGIAVDDFGTGYSSLRYLRRLDAGVVKIDREFVQAAAVERRTEALVGSVVAMAGALGMTCVAEGIETLDQLALARSLGCQLGQGYLLARPVPAGAIEEMLVTDRVWPMGEAGGVTVPGPRLVVVPQRKIT